MSVAQKIYIRYGREQIMHLKKGCKLFVRVDFKTGENEMTGQDVENHLVYVKNIAKERYFLGGGFSNIDGGMCLFEAQNIEEAQKVAQNDPIIEKGFYRSEIYEWNLAVLSEDCTP